MKIQKPKIASFVPLWSSLSYCFDLFYGRKMGSQ